MKRLTKNNELGGYYSDYYGPEKQPEIQKLGKLEDIEDELGIDLVTLFKAMKQGHIWAKNTYGKLECVCDYSLNYNDLGYWFLSTGEGLYDVADLKDYGKTWALTKDELL